MSEQHTDGFSPLLDAEDAALENQLLLLEVQVLRGRVRSMEHFVKRLRKQTAASFLPEGSIAIKRDTYDQLRQANRDLRWLLRRLGSGPLGWLIRGRGGYQKLAETWLDDDAPAPADEPDNGAG